MFGPDHGIFGFRLPVLVDKVKKMKPNFGEFFNKQSKTFWLISGFIITVLLGIVDYFTGPEIAFAFFYLIPVSMVAWFAGKRPGIVTSIISSITWFFADIASGRTYSHYLIGYWNAASRLGFFILVTLLLSLLKKALKQEQELSRKDPLTDAVNSRFFKELAEMEIQRARRYDHPFSVVYIDLDNFKFVNDTFGHKAGDMLLLKVVRIIRSQLRKMDVIGRLGGDEFACLLSETNQEGSRIVVSKLQSSLLEEMQHNDWPVTFSIGVMTFVDAPQLVDQMIQMADELMYSVKKSGKNAVAYSVYTE